MTHKQIAIIIISTILIVTIFISNQIEKNSYLKKICFSDEIACRINHMKLERGATILNNKYFFSALKDSANHRVILWDILTVGDSLVKFSDSDALNVISTKGNFSLKI